MSTEWNGVGLPPVGTTNKDFVLTVFISCLEARNPDVHYEVVAHRNGKAVVVVTRPNGSDQAHIVEDRFLRPIRSAEEVALSGIIDALGAGELRSRQEVLAERVYAAIRDGKIPGVKLED